LSSQKFAYTTIVTPEIPLENYPGSRSIFSNYLLSGSRIIL
jgi:hypothetical protein